MYTQQYIDANRHLIRNRYPLDLSDPRTRILAELAKTTIDKYIDLDAQVTDLLDRVAALKDQRSQEYDEFRALLTLIRPRAGWEYNITESDFAIAIQYAIEDADRAADRALNGASQ